MDLTPSPEIANNPVNISYIYYNIISFQAIQAKCRSNDHFLSYFRTYASL